MKPFLEALPTFTYYNFATNVPFFIWGMLAFQVYRKCAASSLKRFIGWSICVLGFVAMLVLYRDQDLYQLFFSRGLRAAWDDLWGFTFALVTIGLALTPMTVLSNSVSRHLGKISFSLYLVHPHIVFGLGKARVYDWIYERISNDYGLAYLLCFSLAFSIIFLISAITYRFIEAPGMALGRLVSQPPTSYPLHQ